MLYTVKVAGYNGMKRFADVEQLCAYLRALDVVTEVVVTIRRTGEDRQ